jgi:hypothetical protein
MLAGVEPLETDATPAGPARIHLAERVRPPRSGGALVARRRPDAQEHVAVPSVVQALQGSVQHVQPECEQPRELAGAVARPVRVT